MSGGLVPFRSGLPARHAREMLAAEQLAGAIAAQRIRNVGLLTREALTELASISAMEAELLKAHPISESRAGYIVDSAANALAAILARESRGL